MWSDLYSYFPAVSFEDDVEAILADFRENGRESEFCPELEISSVRLLSRPLLEARRKAKKALPELCVFCKNNGETAQFYSNHILKDQHGTVRCPVLRAYTCPTCGARGDNAHTIKYCPLRPVCKPTMPRMIRKTVHY
ncbi:nanos homolog 1-like [Pollicipes pollicipes]|uniref:nanos homolog 1-like n=1 Tax=Pollicipes pollicipes TaxID=41117 RepID=UPI0018859FA4|nr:nanos homolog 1-like [Pollicipes pollicipes]